MPSRKPSSTCSAAMGKSAGAVAANVPNPWVPATSFSFPPTFPTRNLTPPPKPSPGSSFAAVPNPSSSTSPASIPSPPHPRLNSLTALTNLSPRKMGRQESTAPPQLADEVLPRSASQQGPPFAPPDQPLWRFARLPSGCPTKEVVETQKNL